jgi:3-deoxy-D-manno-octulosonic acid kinase
MIKAQVQPTKTGAILFDAAQMPAADEKWFERGSESEAAPADSGGRGSVYFLDAPFGACVLRHYRRGGLVSFFNKERYLWSGRNRTRAFREFRLLARLHEAGLPVPSPLMARYTRRGLVYQADLITRQIPGAQTLATRLAEQRLDAALAVHVGRTLAGFHAYGLWHADLNAHNLLVDVAGKVWLIDFDRCRMRKPGMNWRQSNLDRLLRSFRKLQAAKQLPLFETQFWHPMLAAYHRGLSDHYARGQRA